MTRWTVVWVAFWTMLTIASTGYWMVSVLTGSPIWVLLALSLAGSAAMLFEMFRIHYRGEDDNE
jgi:hypothetical protein